VCKPWQNAVESIRFDQFNNKGILNKYARNSTFLSKYLKAFKKLAIAWDTLETNISWDILGPLIVDNVKKLNEVDACQRRELTEVQKSYIGQVLKNSNTTLTKIFYSGFPLPNIPFPNVTEIDVCLCPSLQEFKTYFPTLLKNCKDLELVRIRLRGECQSLAEYIGKNYPKHCISFDDWVPFILQYLPIKILNAYDLGNLHHKQYTNEVENLFIQVCADDPMEQGWDRYQEIFDQCNKLKKIEFDFFDENANDIEWSKLEKIKLNLWNERMDYFKKRGIEIVKEGNYGRWVKNRSSQKKVAKESGVKWRFAFY
jgi:hypothetical protein